MTWYGSPGGGSMAVMSHLTDMVIIASPIDDEAMARLNAWCATEDPRGQQFERLNTDAAGGTKIFTGTVWAMCGNHFPFQRLAEALPTFGWNIPGGVVLVVDVEGYGDALVVRAV